ncbi:MAG: type II toxin-antitoxin system Phd/YefM family antitoxin, partial [Roseiarcus sp.]
MSAADKGVWTLANAKARLSELVERASREGPQTITRNGKATAVVVSFEEWS